MDTNTMQKGVISILNHGDHSVRGEACINIAVITARADNIRG